VISRGYKAGSWLRGVDLNHRPLGYEPNELPDCSTPRIHHNNRRYAASIFQLGALAFVHYFRGVDGGAVDLLLEDFSVLSD
jgi:hypothetical protein